MDRRARWATVHGVTRVEHNHHRLHYPKMLQKTHQQSAGATARGPENLGVIETSHLLAWRLGGVSAPWGIGPTLLRASIITGFGADPLLGAHVGWQSTHRPGQPAA